MADTHDADPADVSRAAQLASMAMNGDPISGKPRPKVEALPPVIFKTNGSAYWLTRLYVVVAVLVKLWAVMVDPTTALHAILAASGPHAFAPLGALMGLCVVGMLDVLANDLPSPKRHLPLLREHRHVIFMLIGLGLMSVVSAIGEARGFSLLSVVFLVDAAVAVAVAFLDLFARRRKVRIQ